MVENNNNIEQQIDRVREDTNLFMFNELNAGIEQLRLSNIMFDKLKEVVHSD